MAKKIKEYCPSKWVYILFFTLPIVYTLLMVKSPDNDMWYLLSEGRYILNHGIYHIDPLSMHQGFEIIVQNWLSASIFYTLYTLFGEMGLISFVVLFNFFICLLLYKVCMQISDRNKILSIVTMFIVDINLTSHFVVTRPQVISFVILLALILVLEKYIQKENPKILIWIPILSLLEINLHASLWWMLFLFMLPYVIDSFKIPFLNTQGFKKKPLFIAILIAFLVGFINPYGYKAITFIFTSFSDPTMHRYINELLPFTFGANYLCNHMAIIIIITTLIYVLYRKGNIRIRYVCLYCGTLILGMLSVKGFSHFILVSIFPIAYFLKDVFPKDFDDIYATFKRVITIIIASFGCAALVFATALYIRDFNTFKLKNTLEDAVNVMAQKANSNSTVYSSFNDGGYIEFRGFKPYIDPRAEVYLKINNKKADIFKENYDVQHGTIKAQEFIEKYNFDFMVVAYNDALVNYLQKEDAETNYFVIYDNFETKYRVYARNDLYDDNERNEIISNYTQAVNIAKEKSANK